jgi:hypothetical protein
MISDHNAPNGCPTAAGLKRINPVLRDFSSLPRFHPEDFKIQLAPTSSLT